MDFFNIGTGELFFLLLLAILLVGPRRAVDLVQQGGRLLARLRQEWRGVQRDVMAEVQALQKETMDAVDPSLRKIAEEVKNIEKEALAAVEIEKKEPQPPETVPVKPNAIEPDQGKAG